MREEGIGKGKDFRQMEKGDPPSSTGKKIRRVIPKRTRSDPTDRPFPPQPTIGTHAGIPLPSHAEDEGG